MGRLQDKNTVITGGESGIGLATARLFVAEGARVHILGLDEGRLKEAERELGPDRCGYSVADVTDEGAVAAALDVVAGPLDVVFSNAGISGAVSQLVDYPSETFGRTLAVHVLGGFHMIKHGLPRMRDGGSIIITSSVVGLMGSPGSAGTSPRSTARSG